MDSRDRMRAALRRRRPDRVPRYDHFWEEAKRSLLAEAGAPADADPAEVFGLDGREVWFDGSARLPERIVRADARERVVLNEWGQTVRYLNEAQTTGEHLEFGVTSEAVWRESFRDRFRWDRARIDFAAQKVQYARWRTQGQYIFWSTLDPFEATWNKVGPVRHLESLAEEPDWVLDMYTVHADLIEAAFAEQLADGLKPDGVWFWADIAYKNGPMISPAMYRRLLQPLHVRLNAMAHAAGCETVFHSDGDLHALLPLLIEAGFDCFHPLEVKAGMDVRPLKREYGDRASFMGNIDARLYQANDLAGLEREIREKVPQVAAHGGYVFHSDHSVPPGVTLATYRRAQELLDRYGRL